MGTEIDWETRELAEELYIVEGQTYEAVAERTGVSLSQLKRWGADGGWPERKREYRQSLSDIRRETVRLRKELLKQAVTSLDPQNVYAFAAIERACAPKADAKASKENPDAASIAIDRPKLFMEDLEFIARTLKEIDPEGLKVLAGSFDVIIAKYKEQYAQSS